MERLTDKIGNTNCVKGCGSNCKYGFEHCRKENWENCETISDVIDKLAEYEDLEEQCKLIKLPCKVGDTVYKPNPVTLKEIVEIKIDSMFITETNFNISGRTTKMKYSFCCTPKDFGKTVFLTKSEAKAKLKELRGGENEERSCRSNS